MGNDTAKTKPQEDQARDMAAELLLGLLVTGFALFVIIESIRMPQRGHLGVLMSPGFVPLITGLALLMLGLILDVRAIKAGGLGQLKSLFNQIIHDEESRRFLWVTGLIFVYIVGLVGWAPFTLATFIFHLSIFIYLRIGPWWKIGLFTVICTTLVSVLLPELFSMPVP